MCYDFLTSTYEVCRRRMRDSPVGNSWGMLRHEVWSVAIVLGVRLRYGSKVLNENLGTIICNR